MSALGGKRCLVIGAGSGIGRAVVDAFIDEGAQVGALELTATKCAELESVDGFDGPVICGDATSRRDNEEVVGACVDRFGGLDVLVNCVGLFDYRTALADIDPDRFDAAFSEAMNVNVRSHLLSVQVAVPHLRTRRGSIILTCSTSSFMVGRGGVLYVASKFALRGCVVALAHELAPDIRVNGVAPGGTVGTDLRGLTALGLADRSLGEDPDRADSVRRRSRLEVAPTAREQAACYVFLASDAATAMSGRFLHPDGGANLPARDDQ